MLGNTVFVFINEKKNISSSHLTPSFTVFLTRMSRNGILKACPIPGKKEQKITFLKKKKYLTIFTPALIPGQRDKGSRIFFVLGQKDNKTSRPGLSRLVGNYTVNRPTCIQWLNKSTTSRVPSAMSSIKLPFRRDSTTCAFVRSLDTSQSVSVPPWFKTIQCSVVQCTSLLTLYNTAKIKLEYRKYNRIQPCISASLGALVFQEEP